jgi:hypothetical protein
MINQFGLVDFKGVDAVALDGDIEEAGLVAEE